MKQAIVRIRTRWSQPISEDLDPEIKEVLKDPLDRAEIARLALWARRPELADPTIALLPEIKSTIWSEDAYLRQRRAANRGTNRIPLEAFGDWKVPEKWTG